MSLELLITTLGCDDVHHSNKHARSLQKLTSLFVSAAVGILNVTDPLPALRVVWTPGKKRACSNNYGESLQHPRALLSLTLR